MTSTAEHSVALEESHAEVRRREAAWEASRHRRDLVLLAAAADGLSVTEIAALTGLTHGRVSRLLRRARRAADLA